MHIELINNNQNQTITLKVTEPGGTIKTAKVWDLKKRCEGLDGVYAGIHKTDLLNEARGEAFKKCCEFSQHTCKETTILL